MIQGWLKAKSQDAATTGTGLAVDCYGRVAVSVYMVGAGTTSGGTIIIEEAPEATIGGTWSQLASLNASDVNSNKIQATGLPLTPGAYGYVRARISSDITGGGTITIYIIGS